MPSTQRSGNPAAGYIEGESMRLLSDVLQRQLTAAGAIVGTYWSINPDLGVLGNLYAEADRWLLTRTEACRLILSLHSDSGSYSHVFGIYGRPADRPFAERLASAIAAVFRTSDVRVFDRLGGNDYTGYLFVTKTSLPSVLVECGSHINAQDLAILTSDAGREAIAAAIVGALIG